MEVTTFAAASQSVSGINEIFDTLLCVCDLPPVILRPSTCTRVKKRKRAREGEGGDEERE